MENVFEPGDWDDYGESPPGWCTKPRRLVRTPGSALTASVFVVEPGEKHLPYHFHHGAEEVLLVLEGTPTLRTPEGERSLAPGDVAHFPPGPAGAHGMRNDADEPARFVMFGTRVSPEVVEYPDLRQVTAQSRHGLFLIHDVEEGGA